jgi:hypothetical protein
MQERIACLRAVYSFTWAYLSEFRMRHNCREEVVLSVRGVPGQYQLCCTIMAETSLTLIADSFGT